jgi:hypothetical protein
MSLLNYLIFQHELDRLNEQFQEIVEQSQRDREACQAEVRMTV